MTSFCTIHQTQMYPSKFQEGKFYHFTGEITPDGKKVSCMGEGLGKAVRNGHAQDNGNYQPRPQAPKAQDWGNIKDLESKKMLVMSAMKAASEVTKAMLDTGMFDTSTNVDDEVIKRMRKYIAEMEKLVKGTEQNPYDEDPGF